MANLSLGGGFYKEVNEAVNNLVDSDVVVTVSAGNSNDDSCGRSPASADKAITVGSTTKTDARSSFSSYGACVDIFAPGSGIISAYKGGATASRTLSGTSMSAPHVAGLAALYLGENPSLLPAEVARKMLQYDATYGSVRGIPNEDVGTANLLAYAGPNECASKLDGSPCTLPNLCDGTCQGNVCSLPPGKFSFAIKIDEYPGDTSWELRQSSTVVASRNAGYYSPDSGPLFCDQVDIVQGTSYTFEIMDSYGDGICCSEGHGHYSIYDGNTHLHTGSNFESSETKEFTAGVPTETPTGVPTDVPTKAPTQAPTETPTRVPTDVPTKAAPTQAPVACSDSPLRLKIFKEGATKPISRSCEWVERKNTAERCNLTGVSAACPFTCGSCGTCADPELRFKFRYNNKDITRSCEFVGRIESEISDRCAASQNICRETCGTCSA